MRPALVHKLWGYKYAVLFTSYSGNITRANMRKEKRGNMREKGRKEGKYEERNEGKKGKKRGQI